MKLDLNNLVVLARPDETLQSIVTRIGCGNEDMFGIALIVDNSMVLMGVINNGDVIRLLADGVTLEKTAGDVMVKNPITASVKADDEEILASVRSQVSRRTGGKKDLTRYVPLVDDQGRVKNVVDIFSILASSPRQGDHVLIYGLGFVGLTLAVSLASRGHFVTGIDKNSSLVDQLLSGQSHVFEPQLVEMMQTALEDKQLEFRVEPGGRPFRVIIIAVGTPVDDNGSVSLESLLTVCRGVSSQLKRGDLVMLRSTVPVGTTSSLVRDSLESCSNLKAGADFHLAFTPERTAEGRAMQELISLPQIVGGMTDRCAQMACDFWQTLTDSVVRVESLEAAELVKLINNSYRDLSFAFSNGFALLADRFNLDATRIINSANEGYPRNPISKPSPGVGGYCLTKDPYLYASADTGADYALLSRNARQINLEAGLYPVLVLSRFAKRLGRSLSDCSVLCVGLAFKGLPETNDLRGSTGVRVALELMRRGCKVTAYDAIVDNESIEALGIQPVALDRGLSQSDAILILNNHPSNILEGLLTQLKGRTTLLFDGWSQLDRYQIERYSGIVYANMGYMTPEKV